MAQIDSLLEVLQLYELNPPDTSSLASIPHDTLVDAMNHFLFHHGPRFGISSWSDIIQGLRDGGIDSVWRYNDSGAVNQLGVQVKSAGDFDRVQSFRRSVMAQIAESRQYELSHLLLALCADLTNPSHREKARGMLADVARMTDNYVLPISPEKMAGVWRWRQGLNIGPLEQMREAGYAWLTAVYDSLGNLNHNSWGKGTGGAWSHKASSTVFAEQQITLKAIGQSSADAPLEYQFAVQRSGQSFDIRQSWSETDTWTWHIEPADIGRGVCVMVAVRLNKDYSLLSG